MSNTFSTTITNWQGVDDVPTAGSDNLVKSGGVFSSISEEIARLDETDNEIKADLGAEIARAIAAEESNASAIAEEKAAIMGADRIAEGAITTEKLDKDLKENIEILNSINKIYNITSTKK